MESFFLVIKMEWVWQRDDADHGEAIHDMADHIVNFYNSVRLHTKPGGLSPMLSSINRQLNPPVDLSEIT